MTTVFKSEINRYQLTAGWRFPVCFTLFVLLFLVTPCLVVAVQSCMEWRTPVKKKGKKRYQGIVNTRVYLNCKWIKAKQTFKLRLKKVKILKATKTNIKKEFSNAAKQD